jgi:predicted nucleic acid-binding protein
MPPTALIDTNLLVYTYERQDTKRQARALHVLSRLRAASAGYLSVKMLSEFFVVVRRIPDPLTTAEALYELQKHIAVWPVLNLTPVIVVEAARGVKDYGFSYWDAQIWATAKTHQLSAVFTEDMNAGSVIEGVAIINPLVESFDLEAWLSPHQP